jgi:aminoglycoside phosphotransferase (APT) family kinase protein
VSGAVFFVMEDVDGLVLNRRSTALELAPAGRRRSVVSLVRTLAGVHAIDVDRAGLGDLARRDGYAARQLRRWTRQWELTKTREIPSIDRAAALLQDAIPAQREVALVHGDYRLDNVIVDRFGSVRAALDWELATLGDPLADLGLLLAYTPSSEADVLPNDDGVMLLPGFPDRDEIAGLYADASERSVDALPFWLALGYWKIAIIYQGVYRRWLQDPASGGDAPDALPGVIERLARCAAETAARARS